MISVALILHGGQGRWSFKLDLLRRIEMSWRLDNERVDVDILERLRALAHLGLCLLLRRLVIIDLQFLFTRHLEGAWALRFLQLRRKLDLSLVREYCARMGASPALRDPDPICGRLHRGLPLLVLLGRLQCLIDHDLLRLQITNLGCPNVRTRESVILEQAFLDAPVGELHAPSAILDAVAPLTLIAAAIFPEHLAVAMTLVILVAPLVVVTGFPDE